MPSILALRPQSTAPWASGLQASVAMPLAAGEDSGLVVWRARTGTGYRVRGRLVNRAGCATRPAFEISTEEATQVHRPAVAWLGARRFVVTWTVFTGVAAYGMARVLEATGRLPAAAAPTAVIGALRDDVRHFAGRAEQSDDITLLCVRWNSA